LQISQTVARVFFLLHTTRLFLSPSYPDNVVVLQPRTERDNTSSSLNLVIRAELCNRLRSMEKPKWANITTTSSTTWACTCICQ